MRVVYKYQIPPRQGEFELELPKGAVPLYVNEQHGDECLWVLIDDQIRERSVRSFFCAGTGCTMPEDDIQYVGSLFMDGGSAVQHVFEVL